MSQVDIEPESSADKTLLALQTLRQRRQQLVDKLAQLEERLQNCGEAERPKLLEQKEKVETAVEQ